MDTLLPNHITGPGVLVIMRHGTADHVRLRNIVWPSTCCGTKNSHFVDFESGIDFQTANSLKHEFNEAQKQPSCFRLEMDDGIAYRFKGKLIFGYQTQSITGRIQISNDMIVADGCDRLEEVPQFNRLALDDKIWRYMTLAQFCNLGLTRRLHMQSIAVTMQDDPYEGILPHSFASVIDSELPYDPWPWLTSSWCLSNYNNFALWEIYGDRQGVAIQTTVIKLKERLNIGVSGYTKNSLFRIAYLNYDEESALPSDWPQGPWLQDERLPFLCKRHEFKHEQEVRVLHQLPNNVLSNLRSQTKRSENNQAHNLHLSTTLLVHPETMVESVYAHPKSEQWVRKTIQDLVTQWEWRAQFENNVEPHRQVPPFVEPTNTNSVPE